MADYPYPSSPAIQSSMDLEMDFQPDNDNLPHVSKKKKKNRRRSNSTSQLDQDHREFTTSLNLDGPAYEIDQQQEANGGEESLLLDNVPTSTQEQSQTRQSKKGKRESKRAVKIAKQQTEISSSAPEATGERSRFAEVWEAQERAIAAKREHIEEDSEVAIAHHDELVEPSSTTLRKRKRRSQVPDSIEHSSKKQKQSQNGTSGAMIDDHDGQAQNGAIYGAEAAHDTNIDLNVLAEQLYSGRKRRTHHDGPVGTEASGNLDMYQDNGINYNYLPNNNAHGISSIDESMPIDPMLTNSQPNVSMNNSNGPDGWDRNNGLITTGAALDGHGNHGQQNGANGAEGPASGYFNNPASEQVEVPSSMPGPSNTAEASTKRRATTKASTGRKRVPKPDFHSRIPNMDETSDMQSPTAAALSRRKDKGKQMDIPGDGTQAVPSTLGNDTVGHDTVGDDNIQPKTPGMHKDSVSVDGENGTPSSDSVIRLRTPKTPATLSGAFTDFEIRNLSQAIENYRTSNDMTQYQVNELIHSNPKEAEAGDLWESIMAACPNRSRQKVINQTRRRFHNFVARGTWTPEQEQELKAVYEAHGSKYSLIGTIINRHPEDIRDRIRNYLICGENQRKDQWSPSETEKLITIVKQAVAEISKQRAMHGLDNSRPVEDDINWQLVSQGMDRTRSRLQCISKWKAIKPQLTGGGLDGEIAPIEEIIQQARETATTMSYKNRSLVLKAILNTGASADSRIPWLKVRNELGLKYTRPPLMVVWFRLRRTLPNWQSLHVKEICTVLLHDYQQTHKLEYPPEESNAVDYDIEYREIEYKIKRGRKANPLGKSSLMISKTDDEDGDENQEVNQEEGSPEEQPRTRGEEEEGGAEASLSQSQHNIDLGMEVSDEKEPEVADSEPETTARNTRGRVGSRRSRVKAQDTQAEESDKESSDTNASQVSSIPAR